VSAPTCLLADDHPALRAAVAEFLVEAGYRIVGPVADGRAAVDAAREQPDAAVLDYRMPQLAGAELVHELLVASPGTRIVVYTADGGEELAAGALAAGAAGVVLKEAPLADLTRALEAVLAGGTYLDPALAQRDPRARLTEREREVLELLAEGIGHEEIGKRLGIGAETVRTHLRKACDRLEASTRTEAVATALRLGLIA
jgi:two-component system nitrate/nitrite response regulator NarL